MTIFQKSGFGFEGFTCFRGAGLRVYVAVSGLETIRPSLQ